MIEKTVRPVGLESPTYKPGLWVVYLTAALLLVGAVVSYFGISTGGPVQATPTEPAAPTATQGPLFSIDLPHQGIDLPAGPHREQFQVACTVCHSPRLILNQPPLSETQWDGVVAKMIKVYGANVTDEQKTNLVQYLTSVHGPSEKH